MAYSAPTTRATGFLVTAAVWNQDVVDNVTFLANPPACRVYRTATQAMTDATETVVLFTAERFDTDTMHSTSSDTSRITFNTAGLYSLSFGGLLESASDYNNIYATFRLNGATHIAVGPTLRVNGTTTTPTPTCHTIYKFAAADYVEVLVYQDNAANASRNLITFENAGVEMAATWVGLG